MARIEVRDLTFCYDGSYDNIFEHVSFSTDTDWRLGFIGRNGRGKTTFLKLLMGQYEYRGSIQADAKFAYFPYPVEDPARTALEVAQGIHPGGEAWEFQRELDRLEVAEEARARPFSSLSFGERSKVLLAALFLRENSFLLIDEPTNHLDFHARELVSAYLRTKRGFILVSHDRRFLDGCIDHVLSINRMDIEIQRGNFTSWMENQERRERFEQAENERLRGETRRLEAAAAHTESWSERVEKTKFGTKTGGLKPDRGYVGHKAAKMMKRSKAIATRRSEAVEQTAALLKNVEQTEALKLSPLMYHARRLLEARGVAVRYGGRAVCEPVSFTVERGDRIALCGANGSGKTSLLRLVEGGALSYDGTLTRGGGLRVSCVRQDTDGLAGGLRDYAETRGLTQSLFFAILRKLGFARMQFDKDLRDLSGGQKKKVLLAASLCEPAHLYLWDEPLNFVDVLSRIQLEELLCAFQPTIVFVEHDRAFCERVATKWVTLS